MMEQASLRRISPLRILLLATLIASYGNGTLQAADQTARSTVELTAVQPGDTLVKAVFEVEGQLIPFASSPAETEAPSRRRLRAVGQFLYEEQIVNQGTREAVRYYQQAEAEVAIDKSPRSVQLREDRRLISADPQSQELSFRALEGTLTREELELIELPAGSHLVDQLLPGRSVSVDDSWTHSNELVAQLLNLQTVTTNQVESTLSEIEDEAAKGESSGKISGTVAGVKTEIQIQAKWTFHLEDKIVNWVAMKITEHRQPGLTLPGLKATSRIRVLRNPSTANHLNAEVRETLAKRKGSPKLLEFRPDSDAYLLTLDPRWHVYSEQRDLVILRLVDDGRVIGQCNLQSLTPLPVGRQLELPQFQADVQAALGSAVRQVVDAREGELPHNLRQLRVSVVGEASGVPIQWIYYHIDDADNNRVSCVFTMRAEDAEAFGAADMTLVSGLELRPDAATDLKQPLPPAAKQPSNDVAQLPE